VLRDRDQDVVHCTKTVTVCGMSVKMMLKLYQQQFIFWVLVSYGMSLCCRVGSADISKERGAFSLRSRNNLVFLHSVIFQKTWIFNYTGVETSNLAICHSASVSCVSVLGMHGSGKFLSAAIMLASCSLPYYLF